MARRPTGLAKLIGLLIQVCKVIGVYRSIIRTFVPDASKSAYDTALDAILANCDLLRAIDYQDDSGATNAPWGSP